MTQGNLRESRGVSEGFWGTSGGLRGVTRNLKGISTKRSLHPLEVSVAFQGLGRYQKFSEPHQVVSEAFEEAPEGFTGVPGDPRGASGGPRHFAMELRNIMWVSGALQVSGGAKTL